MLVDQAFRSVLNEGLVFSSSRMKVLSFEFTDGTCAHATGGGRGSQVWASMCLYEGLLLRGVVF